MHPAATLLFVAPDVLFLHHVFWLGRHVNTGTCLLQAQFLTFTFVFGAVCILPAVGAYIARKKGVPSSLLKEKWTVKIGNSKKNEICIKFVSCQLLELILHKKGVFQVHC